MKRANLKSTSYQRTINNEQHVPLKDNRSGGIKNYLKTSAFIIAISLVALFSKQIQDTLVSNYNKGVAEMQKHTLYPLGA